MDQVRSINLLKACRAVLLNIAAMFVHYLKLRFFHHGKASYDFHPDFKSLEWIRLNFEDADFLRLLNLIRRREFHRQAPPAGLKIISTSCPGWKKRNVPIEIYSPVLSSSKLPCLIYFHGGGFMVAANGRHRQFMFKYARAANCRVVFVDYALSVDAPYPAGVEDCYSAVLHACSHAGAFGIDANRMAVGGDSAGGALAAAVSQMARDRNGPDICFQMLIYPVIDDRMMTPSAKRYTDTPIWNTVNSQTALKYYLKDISGPVPPYAYPMNAKTFEGLPPAYVETAQFDPLCDEAIAYAKKLESDGVPVRLLETRGTPHGFDVMVADSPITHAALENRIAALRHAFYPAGPSYKR